MIIIPHTADLSLARQPWVTWAVVVLCLLIYIAQGSSRDTVLVSAASFCNDIFSDSTTAEEVAWDNPDECAWELADLRSLPDPWLFINRPEDALRIYPGMAAEEVDRYYETLRTQYAAFALTAPPSLDAKLMYDPTVLNPWRMITSALAHADWWHIIGNLIFFVAFAPILELMAGRGRFIVILLFIAIAESITYSLAVSLSGWPAPTYGLSGVVFGMIGLSAYVVPRIRIRTFVWFFFYVRNHSIPAWVLAAWFIGWNVWDMLTRDGYGGTNFVAHVSGAAAGYLAGMYLMKKQREDYAEQIEDEVEFRREQRADMLGTHATSNAGNYRRVTEQRQMREGMEQYESQMEEVYFSVSTESDSTAIMLLLRDYDLWSESPEVYEEIFRRMQSWGNSRALLCIGRLLIHLYGLKGLTARAQAMASECLLLDPDFALADRMDLGNMFHTTVGGEERLLAERLIRNGKIRLLARA